MDIESVMKQMKVLKAKAKAARKDGKKEVTQAFKSGSARLTRKIKAFKNGVMSAAKAKTDS